MEINWTMLTYFVIGLFALTGFFKGWWKEAVTTVVLTVLVFLLYNPAIADTLVTTINELLGTVWGLLRLSNPVLFDPGDATTWLIIMVVLIMVAVLLSRTMLPGGVKKSGSVYQVRPTGSVLGGLLGGVNGFLIINLIREYLDGRNLPGGRPAVEVASAGGGPAGTASSGLVIKAVEVPAFTILDSFIPWIIIGLGIFVFIALLRSRVGLHSKNGYRRIEYKEPYGYRKV